MVPAADASESEPFLKADNNIAIRPLRASHDYPHQFSLAAAPLCQLHSCARFDRLLYSYAQE